LGKFSKDAPYHYIEKEYKVPKKDIPRRIDELSAGLNRVFGSSGSKVGSLMLKTFKKKLPDACNAEEKDLSFKDYVEKEKQTLRDSKKDKKRRKD
jgi:hypothetical protein